MATKKTTKKASANTKTAATRVPNLIGKVVIVRSYAAGVHVGKLLANANDVALLADTTRLYYWPVAKMTGQVASCSELAQYGVTASAKFGAKLALNEIHGVVEVIPVTPEAARTYP